MWGLQPLNYQGLQYGCIKMVAQDHLKITLLRRIVESHHPILCSLNTSKMTKVSNRDETTEVLGIRK